MRYAILLLLLTGMGLGAQTSSKPSAVFASNLPKTFPELVAALPSLANKMQSDKSSTLFAAYTDAIDKALKKDPSSASAAIPALAKNLQNSDPEVQGITTATLQEFSLLPNYVDLIQQLLPQLLDIISSHNEPAQKCALMDIGPLSIRAPDSAVTVVKAVMLDPQRPEDITAGAAEILLWLRPGDESVQLDILSVMHDPSRPAQLRQEMMGAMGKYPMNPLLVEEVVKTANTSSDIGLRDAAISSASMMGKAVLARISHRLDQIVSDPSESATSHQIAKDAQCHLYGCVETY